MALSQLTTIIESLNGLAYAILGIPSIIFPLLIMRKPKKLALGEQVTVYLDEGNRTRGYYGRLLAYIQLPDKSFLNEVLVAEGFAYADLRFRHSFYYKYQNLQASARRQKKGLWPKVNYEQLPEWLKRKKPKLLSVRTP